MENLIKVLICDDDIEYANNIKNLIESNTPKIFSITTKTDNSVNINEYYDVVFLDIEMPKISGFD